MGESKMLFESPWSKAGQHCLESWRGHSIRKGFASWSTPNSIRTECQRRNLTLWISGTNGQWKSFESKIKPDLIIFLKTDVETVEKRIKKRGRPEEQNIDMNYVDAINRLHEDWLLYQNSSFPVPAPVLVMNGTLSLEDFKTYVKEEMLEKIIPA